LRFRSDCLRSEDFLDEDAVSTQKPSANPNCAELMTLAERELAAFVGAVTELCGPQRAGLAADVWLHELESLAALPGPTSRDWRRVTVAALARLASRLTIARPSATPLAASPDNSLSPQHRFIVSPAHFWILRFDDTNSTRNNCLKRNTG